MATRSPHRVTVLLWNYHDDDVSAPDVSVKLDISGLPEETQKIMMHHYRIDHDHWNNARAFKEAMGLGMSFFQLPRQGYILRFQPRSIEPNEPKTVAKPAETTVRTTAAPATALPAPAISR